MLALDPEDTLLRLIVHYSLAILHLGESRNSSEIIPVLWEARDVRLWEKLWLSRHRARETASGKEVRRANTNASAMKVRAQQQTDSRSAREFREESNEEEKPLSI